jgi:hypothetical protein
MEAFGAEYPNLAEKHKGLYEALAATGVSSRALSLGHAKRHVDGKAHGSFSWTTSELPNSGSSISNVAAYVIKVWLPNNSIDLNYVYGYMAQHA